MRDKITREGEEKIQQVLNDVQAAAYLGLAPQSLRNFRHKRVGPPYVKLGHRVVYLLRDLQDYLQARRIDPEARRGGK